MHQVSSGGGRILLIRHAPAVPLDAWQDSDESRPLTAEGREIIERLRHRLLALRPRPAIVYSSPECRCTETATMVGEFLSAPVTVSPDLREEAGLQTLAEARHGGDIVICVRGHQVLMPFLEKVLASIGSPDTPYCSMGQVWELQAGEDDPSQWRGAAAWSLTC